MVKWHGGMSGARKGAWGGSGKGSSAGWKQKRQSMWRRGVGVRGDGGKSTGLQEVR